MPRKGEIDEVWEALIEVMGWNRNEVTAPMRGILNRAVRDLKEVGATREEIMRRAEVYADRFSGVALTPTALVKWWAECGRKKMMRDLTREEVERARLLNVDPREAFGLEN